MKNDAGWMLISFFAFCLGLIVGGLFLAPRVYKNAYIDCLLDIKNKNPAMYVLKEQFDGEVKWQYNKEYGK